MARLQYGLLAALTACTPLLVSALLLALNYQATYFDFLPANGDETFHWHQPATFVRAGFNGGYYTTDELTPKLNFAHYFSWGLAAPVLYGTVGKIFGWTWYSGVLVNLVLLTASIAAFIALTRLALRSMALLALFLALYPPLLLHVPLHMLEPLHMSVGLVLAGGFYHLMTASPSRRFLWGFAILLLLACWLRITWAIFWLPFWGLVLPRRPLMGLILTALLAGGMFLVFSWTSAPYEYTLGIALAGFGASFDLGLSLYISHVRRNLLTLFGGDFFEILLRLQMAAITLISGWQFLKQRRRSRSLWTENFLQLYNAGGVLALIVLAYNTGDLVDFRFMAGHLLFAVGLLLAFAPENPPNHRRLVGVMLLCVCSVIALPSTMTYYAHWTREEYGGLKREAVALWAQRWQDAGIHYNAGAPSPWCNTVTYSFGFLFTPERVIAFEPGLGLSSIRFNTTGPYRARYLVLSDSDAAQYAKPDELTPVAQYPDTHIFLNNAVACGPE